MFEMKNNAETLIVRRQFLSRHEKKKNFKSRKRERKKEMKDKKKCQPNSLKIWVTF